MKYLIFSLFLLIPFTTVQAQGDCSQPSSSCPSCCQYDKNCSFNCHQYVRGCILGDVNLSTGVPYDDDDLCALDNGNINSSDDFIEVCYSYQSDAASLVGVDHSAYKKGSPYPYLSTPNGSSQMLCSGHPVYSICLGSAQYEHFAYIDDVNVNGASSLTVGTTYTYTMSSLPSGVTIDYVYINPSYGSVEETNSNNFKIKALNPTTGTLIKVYLKSNCSGSSVRYRSKTVSITSGGGDPCTGSLNSGPLYTFNSVSSSSNVVVMNSNYWSWQLTGGSASYTTSGSGQTLDFNMYSSCVSFRGYKSGCGYRNYTFCQNYYGYRTAPSQPKNGKIQVYEIRSGQLMKTLDCVNCTLTNWDITQDLPIGIYIITQNETVEKFAKIY